MAKKDKVLRALKCTKNEHDGCTICDYAVPFKDPSKGYLDYCDLDRLETDAANLIEQLTAKVASLEVLKENLLQSSQRIDEENRLLLMRNEELESKL